MKSLNSKPLRQNIFLFLVVLVSIAFFILIRGFLIAAFWAVVLSLVFHGTYRKLSNRWKGQKDGRAALLTTLLIIAVVVIPLTLITLSLVNQSTELYENINAGHLTPTEVVGQAIEKVPGAEDALSSIGWTQEVLIEKLNNFGLSVTKALASRVWSSTQGVLNFFAQFFLMLYMLFFFLKDGDKIIEGIINVFPMGNRRERMLIDRFTRVTRATLKGTVIVAAVQGFIGGILFWIVGIDAPVFWGVLMMLLALLPVGGSGIIWMPAAIILLLEGEYVNGIVVLVVGSLIIGLVDNLLRPLLVGRDTKMPDYLILIATLGGIAGYGLSGFIIGPVIAALFLTCWEMMGEEYGGSEM